MFSNCTRTAVILPLLVFIHHLAWTHSFVPESIYLSGSLYAVLLFVVSFHAITSISFRSVNEACPVIPIVLAACVIQVICFAFLSVSSLIA